MSFHTNNIDQTFYGSFILVSNVTYTGGNAITFSGRGNYIFTQAGKTLSLPSAGMVIAAPSGQITLGSALSTGARDLIITNGGFLSSTYDVTINSLRSNYSTTRTINMGSGAWTISGNNTNIIDLRILTGLTFTGNSGLLTVSDTGANSKTINIADAGLTFGDLSVTGGGAGVFVIVGNNTWGTVTINNPKTVNLTSGDTQTVSDFEAVGDAVDRIVLQSVTADSISTVTKTGGGTIECDYLDVIDVTGTPADTWYYGANGSADNASGWAASPSGAATGYMTCMKGIW
jgi:hypothetical protein